MTTYLMLLFAWLLVALVVASLFRGPAPAPEQD